MKFFLAPNPEEKNPKIIQKKQNIFLGIILFLGMSAFIIGFFQTVGKISSAFIPKVAKKSNTAISSINNTKQLTQEEQIALLKNKDTDKDGINDFDELSVYQTSPYVKDSDSDGKTDKQEVDAGTDPNCVAGKECLASSYAAAMGTNTATSAANTSASVSGTGALSSQDLRASLKNLGVPASLVDSMDDATLKKVYEDTMAETGISQIDLTSGTLTNSIGALTPPTTTGSEITLDSLLNMSPAQIRQLLKESGVSDSDLSQVDDNTLQLIYQQMIKEEMGNATNANLNLNASVNNNLNTNSTP